LTSLWHWRHYDIWRRTHFTTK